ncbi:MAG: ComEA family DNA-binding protein [Phycisphaerales bacterium]
MPQNWTHSAAKWAAVAVLGTASVAGVAYSIASGRTSISRIDSNPALVIPAERSETRPTFAPRPKASTIAAKSAPGTPALGASDIAQPPPAPTDPRININVATAAELELLPGIGPALAKRVIDFRDASGPFKTIDDLDKVSGIGPKIMQRLRPLVRVE